MTNTSGENMFDNKTIIVDWSIYEYLESISKTKGESIEHIIKRIVIAELDLCVINRYVKANGSNSIRNQSLTIRLSGEAMFILQQLTYQWMLNRPEIIELLLRKQVALDKRSKL